jgi:type 1 fimbria pilin
MNKLIALLLLVPSFAFAGWSTTSGKVTDIYSHDGIVLLTTEITDGPCDVHGGFWWPITDDDSQIMLSLALTSFSIGKKITVVFDSSTPNCTAARAQITHLRILNEN